MGVTLFVIVTWGISAARLVWTVAKTAQRSMPAARLPTG
jgi:hypothetical protein